MTNQDALIILNGIPGVGNKYIRRLVEQFGTPADVLSVSVQQYHSAHIIPEKVVQNIIQFPQDTFLQNEYNFAREEEVTIITYLDDAYPALLREIPDAPVVLYVKGDCTVWEYPCIALVGSREASVYGLTTARQFAGQLAEKGFVVVSGLARGIDTISHQGALQAKGKTIAVVGCGLKHIYPAQNKKLFLEVAENGAVVSEFPMTLPPIAHNFPRRNRIISGLSLGVVVIEASEKSGALITSDFALEQGREVFAVPGQIGNFSSTGVNNLIKQGAKLVTSIEDVIEDLAEPFISTTAKEQQVEQEPEAILHLNDEETKVSDVLKMTPTHIDEISILSGINSQKLFTLLVQMEMKGLIKQLPGKHYIRPHSKEKVYV